MGEILIRCERVTFSGKDSFPVIIRSRSILVIREISRKREN